MRHVAARVLAGLALAATAVIVPSAMVSAAVAPAIQFIPLLMISDRP